MAVWGANDLMIMWYSPPQGHSVTAPITYSYTVAIVTIYKITN